MTRRGLPRRLLRRHTPRPPPTICRPLRASDTPMLMPRRRASTLQERLPPTDAMPSRRRCLEPRADIIYGRVAVDSPAIVTSPPRSLEGDRMAHSTPIIGDVNWRAGEEFIANIFPDHFPLKISRNKLSTRSVCCGVLVIFRRCTGRAVRAYLTRRGGNIRGEIKSIRHHWLFLG